jgi:toxin ParE1/3/4
MRRVVWSDTAREDLRAAIRYIAAEDPGAARLVRGRIDRTVALLAEAAVGHHGRVQGTYEKLVQRTSYILAYAISDSTITILHLIHAHRDWPEGAWPADD